MIHKRKQKKTFIALAAFLILAIVLLVIGYFYMNKNIKTLESAFVIDGITYQCSKAIPTVKSSYGATPKNIEDVKNYCRPYKSTIETNGGCGPGSQYCIEYKAVIDILKREDVNATISKYGSVRSSVKALGHRYINDKDYLKRILPAYNTVVIDCIIVVSSPEGTRFFLENGETHVSHNDHKYIEVPSEEFLTSLYNAPQQDITAFWVGLH